MNIRWLFLLFPFYALGNTSHVKSSFTEKEFQLAIDNTRPHDTLYIEPGTYQVTTLNITKPIYLEGIRIPVIDGRGLSNVLLITGSEVTVKGIKVINSGPSNYSDPAGIRIENAHDIKITGCVIENCLFGIYFANTESGIITANRIKSDKTTETASGNGIHLWKCTKITIRNNTIEGHRDGIYLEFTTHSVISENKSIGNIRYGLHFMFSHNDSYKNNTFKNNGAGVAVMYTKGVIMMNNDFVDNKGAASYGLLLKDISDSRIEGNRFNLNTCAITMEECNRIDVIKNEFTENGWGIRIQASCSGNTIKSNNFTGNTFDITTNGTMVMNSFSENYWDKYNGYDLNKDTFGDIPYHPVSLYAIIADKIPVSMILYRSFVVTLLEQMEKIIPSITPEQLIDSNPRMKPLAL